MKIGKMILFVLFLAAGITVSAVILQRQQIQLADKIIRLHVVANSDDIEDQRIKLKVRDAVLSFVDPLLRESDDPEGQLLAHIDLIRNVAEDCLMSSDDTHSVQVTLCSEEFPTRHYDTFSLPAGQYTSLKIVIGEGDGQNWWCVVFPSICLRATGEWEAVAVSAGITENEIGLITVKDNRYLLKFKIMELVQRLQTCLINSK